MLERLELEYPFDKEVQDLRKMYDAAYNEEQERLKREREQREYDKRREDIIRQISEFEQDVDFWQPNNEEMASHSNYVNLFKLKAAVSLLDKAEEYKIECQKFRALMWELLKNVQSGKLVVGEVSLDENADKYYNMFIMAKLINDNEIELEKRKNTLKESPVQWRKAMNNRIKFGFILTIVFILLFFFSKSAKDDLALYLGGVLGLSGGWVIIYTLFCILVYQSPNSLFKKIIATVKEQLETERKINDDISKISKILDEVCQKYDYIENDYKEITLNKLHG